MPRDKGYPLFAAGTRRRGFARPGSRFGFGILFFVGVPLSGARVVIIGGSSGIGLATAKMAHGLGARVTIAGRDAERLEAAKGQVGGDVDAVQLDVADELQVRELFASISHVDHVVSLAGAQVAGRITDVDLTRLRHPMEVRFWGSVHLCKYAAPRMGDGGSITLCSGVVAQRAMPGRSIGTASTSATEAFARAMALELAPVRVNAIRPGTVDTPLTTRLLGDRRDDYLAGEAKRLPVGRVGQAEDLAHAIRFLMENPFVTGITLTVDGGHLLL
jgi:NAD(P)-dependent dehydrogenase (short-subunit alcohol dehydrogenase family)